jgi:hypothetical protein
MRTLTTLLTGILLVGFCATSAQAQRYKYPPGPPYRSCPDSVSLFSVQQTDTTLAPCHPATLDTVWGVRGIITAWDANASAFGFYMQNTYADGAHPWTGADIFTGATNYKSSVPGTPTGGNLALGDSVVIYGTTQEFPASNGETEIEGPDAVQSTNDIIIRKINGGNALPPFQVGTTADFNWVPGISAATAEPWEGCLVRIDGPLKVARVQQGAGVGFAGFLIVHTGSTGDSVLIDGVTLATPTFGVPPLNTPIDYVQGVLNQRNSSAGTGSVNSYRIQLTSGNDISLSTPPNLTAAYPIEDNVLRLVFDRNLDPINSQIAGKYSLGSALDGSTVDAAVLESSPGNVVRLTITSVLVDGDIETVNASGIGSLTCPTCLISPAQTLTFVNGVLTIKDVQKPDPAFLPLFDDRSRFAGAGTTPGTRLTFRGVSIDSYGSLFYLQDAAGGLRSGVSVFGPSTSFTPGNKYLVAGQVQEFGGETEIVSTVYIVDEGVAGPGERPQAIPLPVLELVSVLSDTTTDMAQNQTTGEDYECMLVRAEGMKCTENRLSGESFFAAGDVYPSYPDTILISNLGSKYTYTPQKYHQLNVNGVLHMSNNIFRILPRSDADIEILGFVGADPTPTPRELSLSVAPNPARSARITFALPNRTDVDLAVFDLLGRQIRQIAKGSFEPGTYSRAWDGTNASGGRVRAGMYFYRLKAGGKTLNTRGVMLN